MLLHKDFEVPTCRRRLLEVLSFVDEEGPASALQGGSDDDETSSDVIQDLPGESTSERDFLDALERLAALYGEGFSPRMSSGERRRVFSGRLVSCRCRPQRCPWLADRRERAVWPPDHLIASRERTRHDEVGMLIQSAAATPRRQLRLR